MTTTSGSIDRLRAALPGASIGLRRATGGTELVLKWPDTDGAHEQKGRDAQDVLFELQREAVAGG